MRDMRLTSPVVAHLETSQSFVYVYIFSGWCSSTHVLGSGEGFGAGTPSDGLGA